MPIRRMTAADVPAVLRLTTLAGWNQTPHDIARLLALAPEGCLAAVSGDEVIGTTTTTSYGKELAWIGMVLVDPAHRRRGVATELMETALASLRQRGVGTVMLDATPEGRPVYERLGFEPERMLERWEGIAVGDTAPLSHGEWAEVAELDRAVFAADRGALMRRMIAETPFPFLVARSAAREAVGYALARPGRRAAYVGPVIAQDLTTARALLRAMAGELAGQSMVIDIDPGFVGATELAHDLGLTRQRQLLRMRRGPARMRDGPAQAFAIAGPEVG